MQRTWSLPQPSGRRGQLVDALGLSPSVAEILVQRGIDQVKETVEFLRPSRLDLVSPFRFQHMERAVNRLEQAYRLQEKILVYGDYDVDGVTSVTLLYRVLTDLGFRAVAYIPHRLEEGYGLHREAIEKAHSAEVKLIISVDCGITAVEEVDFALSLGIDTIITDHHEPPQVLPKALAIIDPKADASYPFKELAGVGVAFKLAQALLTRFWHKDLPWRAEEEVLDLVALGTIADVVPLVGENRVLVKAGLKQMEQTVHTGLRALLEVTGLWGKELKAGQVAFILAPRINAVGRMSSPRTGLELLLTGNPEKARDLAQRLNQENQVRQETEKQILAEALAQLEGEPLPRVIVLSSPDWHHGVIGIVASRLVERYYRPVFLISEAGEEGKGSARGIPGYHVLEQLSRQKQYLLKFGGHRQAAGFSLRKEQIQDLRNALNLAAADFPDSLYRPCLNIDCQVNLNELEERLVAELEQMAPFGFGNPGPTLGAFGVPVASVASVGRENQHLKFRFGKQGELDGIYYRQGANLASFQELSHLDVAFSLELNEFRGERKIQLVIEEAQPRALCQARVPNESTEDGRSNDELSVSLAGVHMSNDGFSEIKAGMSQVAASTYQPERQDPVASGSIGVPVRGWTREEMAEVYRSLRKQAEAANPFLWHGLPGREWEIEAVKVFEEMGLIRCLGGTNPWLLEILPVQGKLNLDKSLRLRGLRAQANSRSQG